MSQAQSAQTMAAAGAFYAAPPGVPDAPANDMAVTLTGDYGHAHPIGQYEVGNTTATLNRVTSGSSLNEVAAEMFGTGVDGEPYGTLIAGTAFSWMQGTTLQMPWGTLTAPPGTPPKVPVPVGEGAVVNPVGNWTTGGGGIGFGPGILAQAKQAPGGAGQQGGQTGALAGEDSDSTDNAMKVKLAGNLNGNNAFEEGGGKPAVSGTWNLKIPDELFNAVRLSKQWDMIEGWAAQRAKAQQEASGATQAGAPTPVDPQQLLDYYHRIMEELVRVSDAILEGGLPRLFEEFPEYADNYRGVSNAPGWTGKLEVERPFMQPDVFPADVGALQDAILYSLRNYDQIKWDEVAIWIKSINFPFWPGINIDEEAFYADDPARAIQDLIHEPQHNNTKSWLDWWSHENIQKLVPTIKNPSGPSIYSSLINFLKAAIGSDGRSLWQKILDEVGPSPMVGHTSPLLDE